MTEPNIQIYDTMTRSKRVFKPINPPKVTMYVCGPTVYGDPHIGNIRSFTSGDLIRRWLEYRGYTVKYVMNITDIDDKTIRDSGKAGKTLKDFTEYYTTVFLRGLDALNIKRATVHPRATVYVPQMVDFIKTLEELGYAYDAEDGVYFDISKFEGYGKLSGMNLEKVEQTERMSSDEYDKENAQDFALWKKATPEEMDRGIYFESPWGPGRPGWHIECSVMSKSLLGETIDIHAGGEDLAFPHHENEVAQSEALTGKPFVHYWVHMRHLMIDGGKMSKSLGNYVSFDDVLAKHSPDAFRYFYISTHYRRPLNFTWAAMESSENTVKRLENTLDLIDNAMKGPDTNLDYHEREEKLLITVRAEKQGFIEAMDDDFDTPVALGHLHAVAGAINDYLQEPANKGVLEEASETYHELLHVLGLFEKRSTGSDDVTDNLMQFITDLRMEQRLNKNYALADEIRDRLKEIGVEIQDTSDGTTWKIK
ncbi:MAG: cysteine--tRNA ligase [Candidatus Bathyarchaeota archaeon]|nr:cysteine--tRNA ligase [Candidatus Bathyarchaeota archaeon]